MCACNSNSLDKSICNAVKLSKSDRFKKQNSNFLLDQNVIYCLVKKKQLVTALEL